MRLHPSFLAPLLLFAAASCGGSSDPIDDGYAALNSGKPADAVPDFESALAGMDAADPRYLEAKLGLFRALCHTDPAKAKNEFLAFAKASSVEARHYTMQVTDLVSSATSQAGSDSPADKEAAVQTIGYAVEILAAGKTTYPQDTKWDSLMDIVGKQAETLGAEDALAGLAGLGYVGGD